MTCLARKGLGCRWDINFDKVLLFCKLYNSWKTSFWLQKYCLPLQNSASSPLTSELYSQPLYEINLFCHFLTRKITFATPCLFPRTPAPFWKVFFKRKELLASSACKFFPFRVNPFPEGCQNIFEGVAFPESVSVPLNSFPACGYFCRLLITLANSLDPDQARQNFRPDLDQNCLTHWWYSWKIFLKKLI